jgi:hypothetical protein
MNTIAIPRRTARRTGMFVTPMGATASADGTIRWDVHDVKSLRDGQIVKMRADADRTASPEPLDRGCR